MRRVIEGGDPTWDTEKGGPFHLVFGSHLKGYVQGYTVRSSPGWRSDPLAEGVEPDARPVAAHDPRAKFDALDGGQVGRTIRSQGQSRELGIDDAGMDPCGMSALATGSRSGRHRDLVERVGGTRRSLACEQGEGFKPAGRMAEDLTPWRRPSHVSRSDRPADPAVARGPVLGTCDGTLGGRRLCGGARARRASGMQGRTGLIGIDRDLLAHGWPLGRGTSRG